MHNSKAIFFLRHYNDIDHIVPIIYKLLETTKIRASVIVTSSSNLFSDYRLQFLHEKYSVPIRWVGEFLDLPQTNLHRLMHWSNQRGQRDPFRLALKGWDRYVSPLHPLTIDAANSLLDIELENTDRAVLAFDWRNSEQQVSSIRPLISAAHARGIHVVALPHGDSPYYNRMFYQRHINYEFWDRFQNDAFDHVVVPNELTAERYKPYRTVEQIHVLGSPRYNREWLDILEPLLPPYTNSRAGERRRVVLFLRNPIFPIFWEELGRTLSLITQFDKVYLVVKHHTRQSTLSMRKYLAAHHEPWTDRTNIEFVFDDVHSSALIKWSDLILDIGTSVVSEAVILNKPVLAPEYLHANITTLAHYMPHTALRCRDDLYDALVSLIENPELPRYKFEDERLQYIREIIEYPTSQVLERYVDFLRSLLN